MRGIFHKFGILIRFLRDLAEDGYIFIDVVFGVGLTRLERKRFRDDPWVVAGPVMLQPKVGHPAQYVFGSDARVLLEFLPAVAHLFESPPSRSVAYHNAWYFAKFLQHVLVV